MEHKNIDEALWMQLKNGERAALEIIYKNEITDLVRYGRRFTTDIELIEDCIHDMFIYIWSKRDSLSETDSIRKYLLVSLRHKLLNTLTKNKKTLLIEPDENLFESESSIETEITSRETHAEMKAEIEASMHILSDRQKEAIFLKFNNELSYDDICQIMNINYQSARNLISSGLKKLQTEIKKQQK
jgi:RNA polymerase sigma factor (sigma-70 family)